LEAALPIILACSKKTPQQQAQRRAHPTADPIGLFVIIIGLQSATLHAHIGVMQTLLSNWPQQQQIKHSSCPNASSTRNRAAVVA
jgi:hypothetical protein